ncbi:MAG: hypothetical protein N4A49_00290 [Marinifilaceae bacterium]|jgi:hypothetical protein|nr:hypothetical protein [Marinifilaceae bacterium]
MLRKNWLNILFCFLGGLGGFIYWKFVDCSSGSCFIKSNWYTMCAYGALIGVFISSFFPQNKKQD